MTEEDKHKIIVDVCGCCGALSTKLQSPGFVHIQEPSAIYYGIICPHCGPVELTRENYDWQMNRPNVGWVCPNCGRPADWDDIRHDASMEAQDDRPLRNDR